jgi:UDP-N-acetyl-2-amino-2-deoxyglucuronate dehydrogenase
MAEPVRVALIGCGGIATAHLRGYAALPELGRVVVACDSNAESARQRAEETGALACFDYREALAREEVEAVDLCLPHDLHEPVARAAAAAGKHVLVEKPIARNLPEADRMIAACAAAGVHLMVAHCQRFSADRQTARRLVEDGALGRVYLMRTDHNQWVDYPPGHWINDPEKLGGGGIAGSGVHHLDTLRWFCGDVARVSAGLSRSGRTARTAEDAGVVLLEHENGAVSELVLSWTTQRFPWYESFWIYGAEGVIHNVGGLQMFRGTARQGQFERVPTDHDDAGGFREEIRHFLTCVRTGARPRMPGEEARAALELVLAAYRSAERGEKVALPIGAG